MHETDIYYAVGMVVRYHSNPGKDHSTDVKNMFRLLQRTRNYVLSYKAVKLFLLDYIELDFQIKQGQSKVEVRLCVLTVKWSSHMEECKAAMHYGLYHGN